MGPSAHPSFIFVVRVESTEGGVETALRRLRQGRFFRCQRRRGTPRLYT